MRFPPYLLYLLFFAALTAACTQPAPRTAQWTLLLRQPGQADVVITALPADLTKPFSVRKTLPGLRIDFSLQPREAYAVFKALATRTDGGKSKAFFSLRKAYAAEVPYNFNGPVESPEIYRQSPHDTNAWIVTTIAEQAMPVVALQSAKGFEVALCGSPYLYDNFTSQAFYTNNRWIDLSSGDNGLSLGLQPDTSRRLQLDYNAEKTQQFAPGKVLKHYHAIAPSQPHTFEGLLFRSASATTQGLRKDIIERTAAHFSKTPYRDYFGALAFTTAYMNLRVNETGKSRVWVVPSVEYSNTQYGRDAFWISMMLPPGLSSQCLQSELAQVNHFAEYPLFTIIWAYRALQQNIPVDLPRVQAYVDAVEKRVRDHYYYSFSKADGRLDFQYWGDVMAFEKDDVITYNQGLYALALAAAREMGLKLSQDPEKALEKYRGLYNRKLGFYPVSKKKNTILGPDPLIPDLLSQLYLNRKMLDRSTVQAHFDRMVRYSKTPYGFKIVATPTGEYLPAEQYDIRGYVSQVNREKMPDGRYFRGGSYFLYDNLFLIDAYLHNVAGAGEQLTWRIGLDFGIGNTTYECLNTKTGEPWKPNMGWNVAIYAIWKDLVDRGLADDTLLRTINGLAARR